MKNSVFFLLVLLLQSAIFSACSYEKAASSSCDPIGVFDSGVGGMTVLEQMLKMDLYDNVTGERKSDGRADFENERFVYFGDQANMPYGDYAAAGKSEYLKKLICADADFLFSNKAKAVVIACNTATAWGLPLVAERASQENAVCVGVIGAGVASVRMPCVTNAPLCWRRIQNAALATRCIPVENWMKPHGI